LEVLLSNVDNKIKSWEELDKLRELPEFENTMLVGNPFYELLKDDAKYYALKKIPNLKIIDGIIVQATFAKKSNEFPDSFPPPIR
jgi:dynein light chain 1